MFRQRNWGMILLAIYLILVGIISLFSVAIDGRIVAVVALAGGVLILLGR